MNNVIAICQDCRGSALYMGALGSRLLFRCRGCGADQHIRCEAGPYDICDCCGELTLSADLVEVDTGDRLCAGCEEDDHFHESDECVTGIDW